MRDRGWFGPSEGDNQTNVSSSMGSYNITWSLIEDERKSSRFSTLTSNKIKFEWNDLASVSPVVSVDKKLNEM